MSNATPADAQIVMQLYELRRETEMRKARNWYSAEFNPQSVDDVMEIVNDMGSDRNRYFRMLTGYWEMAAAFVVRGALNEELFLDTQQEFFFYLAKIYPFTRELRRRLSVPEEWKCEMLVNRSNEARKRLEHMLQRLEARRAAASQSR